MNGLMIATVALGIVSTVLLGLVIYLSIRLRAKGFNSEVFLQEMGFKEKCIRSALDEMMKVTGHLKSIDAEANFLAEELEEKKTGLTKVLQERNDAKGELGRTKATLRQLLTKLNKRGVFLTKRDNGKVDKLHKIKAWIDLHKLADMTFQEPKEEEQPAEEKHLVMAQ